MNRILITLMGLVILYHHCFSNSRDVKIGNSYLTKQNSVESNWRWGVFSSGGPVIFISGAEDIFKNTYHIDVAFEVYLKRFYFNPELVIINAKLYDDIIQGSHTFPKKAGVQILRYNLNFSYLPLKHKNFDLGPLFGISFNPFGISPAAKEEYDIKNKLEGFHFGYSLGLFLNFYFPYFENQMGNFSKWGFRFKFAYNSLREEKINKLSGSDLTTSIGLVLNVFDIL